MFVTEKIKYVGVNDHLIDLFEGQYQVENGMSYNSYLICDDVTAVVDAVDSRFADEWIGKISDVLGNNEPDYLIIHHMEPDHSAGIAAFTEKFKNTKIVSAKQSFVMMKQFFGTDFENRRIIVGEGDKLSLGSHTLNFLSAPMVHWPEVIVSYESSTKTIFSADAFGKFGALDCDEEWVDSARRYYIGIVGKYGVQVQSLLKKVANLDIERICPLHGPVLAENLAYYIDLYNKWSSYTPETDGVLIAYTSVYGNTKKAVIELEKLLKARNVSVVVRDLARCDMSQAVSDAFRYSRIVLATTTYNTDIFPFMREFIENLTERNFQNRKIGFIENGSWAPTATKIMKKLLEESKNIEYTEVNVTIKSALSSESAAQLEALAAEI